jgi:hypothetical protein
MLHFVAWQKAVEGQKADLQKISRFQYTDDKQADGRRLKIISFRLHIGLGISQKFLQAASAFRWFG